MKKYKLLKDTPTIKAGTIFEEVIGDFDGLKALTRITPVGAKTSPQFTIKDIDNFKDWFEEIPEHKRWRAEEGDEYHAINWSGSVHCFRDTRQPEDDYRYKTGNYGRTVEELEAKREYDIARQVLLDDAEDWKFTLWEDNYFAYYYIADGGWGINWGYYYCPGEIYFKDKESLRKSLEVHKEQWEIVRKYEMGEM